MKIKFINKLIISFLVVILISTTLGVIISNNNIDKNFNKYMEDKKAKKMEIIFEVIEKRFDEKTGLQYTKDLDLLAKSESFYVVIKDVNDNITYETSNEYLRNTEETLLSNFLKQSKEKIYKNYYREETHEIIKENRKVGDISIGYYSVDNCGVRDLEMKRTIYNILIKTSIITFSIGIVISIFLAKHFSKPLKNITETTNEIRKGNLKVDLYIKNSTYEIDELAKSINYLVKSLESRDKLRKRLTSDMAHEIRTPLTTLQNTMEAFLCGIWEPTSERIESCHEEIKRLSRLVEKLQDTSRLEESNMKLNIEEFNLHEEIKHILDLFTSQYKSKNISLNFNCSEQILIKSDKDKLRQILINLLNNSYIYTKEGGKVEVVTKKKDKNTIIYIKDDGIGISSEELPFIFDRFYRTDETRSRKTGGTGIGLTISKAMVEALGGSIKVQSKLGEGTVFIISL